MKKQYSNISLFMAKCLLLVLLQQEAAAQSPGSRETITGYMAIANGCTQASASESLYIGPGTYVVNGTWEVYSKNIWISPDAVISGAGVIRLYNPSVAGGAASSSLTDGNNSSNFTGANMALHNASDMTLTDLALPADLSSAGWSDAAGNASLSIGANFDFAVANGDALIGNYDMTLSSTGTLSGYREDRFVVTAGSGHLVKQNFSGSFIFPVGMAPGDYTPMQITNAVANGFHVNVTNYDGVNNATFAGAIATGRDGVNRGWNIYADNAAGNSSMNLQHNDSTEGYIYSDLGCFVTRFTGVLPNSAGDYSSWSYWEANNQAAGTGTGSLTTGTTIATASERSRTYTSFATAATDNIAWYTKASDLLAPLPVTLTGFSGRQTGCETITLAWQTTQEQQVLAYEIEQSNDGIAFTSAGTVTARNLSGINTYNFTAAQSKAVAWYRIKIKSAGGNYRYSNAVSITMDCNSTGAVRLYPQPFVNTLTIVLSAGTLKSLQVMDITGKTVQAPYVANGNIILLDGTSLAPGVYVLRLLKNDGTITYVKTIRQ